MNDREELIGAFSFMGQNLSEIQVNKCLELCSKYKLSGEDFADLWSAFSINNLKGGPLTLEALAILEKKELKSKAPLDDSVRESNRKTSNDLANKSLNKTKNVTCVEGETPASPVNAFTNTNELSQPATVSVGELNSEPMEVESSQTYSQRLNSGEIMMTYGLSKSRHSNHVASVKIMGDSKWYKPEKFQFPLLSHTKLLDIFTEAVDYLGKQIVKANNLPEDELKNTIIYGRINPEKSGRLNAQSFTMNQIDSVNALTTVYIKTTDSYSLFPGQTVAVKGFYSMGRTFMAEKIFTKAPLEFITDPPNLEDSLEIVVAAGPFTMSDNFLYEPLQDLLKYVVETKPNVLILLGPFIDADSDVLSMTDSAKSYFDSLVDTIMDCFKDFEIQVVLVASSRDLHHIPVFPSPAYITKSYKNLTCAPDPCILNIDNITIGISTTDNIFQLAKEELSKKPQIKDRISRLASHLIYQRSFNPLYSKDNELNFNFECLLKNCMMDVKPHIIISPSKLRYFVKPVDKCLFINPEKLVKNKTGGTFATLSVDPTNLAGSLVDNIYCQIRCI